MNGLDQWAACSIRATWQSAVLAMVVLVLCWALRRGLGGAWRCGLWLLVALRLMLPVLPSSRASVFNLLDRPDSAAATPALPANSRVIVTVGYGPIQSNGKVTSLSPRSPGRWFFAATILWAAGFIILFVRRIFFEMRSARSSRQMPAATEECLLALVDRCCAEMKLWRRVRVMHSDMVRTPAVCGFWRTTLILPANLAMDRAALRMVILHELAHVRRWDLQMERVIRFARDLHWFNPAAWMMLRCWRQEREMACDEMVLHHVGMENREQYGRVILNLVERFSSLPPAAGAVGLFESQSGLRKRIIAIGRFQRSKFPSAIGWLVLLAITFSMLTDAKAQNATAPATDAGMRHDQADVIIRVYDISDLVARMPESPKWLDASMDDLDAQFAAKPDPKKKAEWHAETVSAISKTLHDAVPVNSWKDKGGTGSITPIPGLEQIIVAQSPEAQGTIAKVLANYRRASGRQINIDSHFLILTNAELRKINLVPDETTETKEHPDIAAAAYLTDEQVKTLLQAAQNDQRAAGSDAPLSTALDAQAAGISLDAKHRHFPAPRLTVYNSQEAYVSIETQSAYVSGFSKTSVRGKQEYKPQTSVLKTGDALEVCPTISPDEKYVTVWLRARQKRLVEMKLTPWKDDPKLQFQQPVVDVHEGHSIMSIPNNKTLMMQLNDTATETPRRSNWILLRPQVVEATK